MTTTLRDLSAAQMVFQVAGQAVDQFLVVRFRGTEGLCQLFRFEIDVVCTDRDVDFESLVGKGAVLSVNTRSGPRWFYGIISRFGLTNETVGQCYFRVQMVPALWMLTHRYTSRIFQGKTVVEIVQAVLTEAGFAADDVRVDGLQARHEPREYCVQYRETDFNFVCRLMEEEGIWWYFGQEENGHVLVLADSASAYQPIDDDATLPYQAPTGLNVDTPHVFAFRRSRSVRSGSVVLRDFDFEKPRLDLESRHDLGRDAGLEFSDYPGEYTQQATGKDLSRIRAEEFEAGRIVALGQSNSARLGPARTFDLSGHPSEKLNGSYLLTAVTHQGKQATTRTTSSSNGRTAMLDSRVHQSLIAARQSEDSSVRELAEALLQISAKLKRGNAVADRAAANWLFHAGQVSRDLPAIASALGASPQAALTVANLLEDPSSGSSIDDDCSEYECQFECIPATVEYRPSRTTPWPVMRGSQTARVVGPAGEEIHTDAYGRVKVQFNWDRAGRFDDNSSCWIRVSQGMAGGNYGIMFLPRVGQEVIVDFLEGDPDKPIITGRVYNADHMPPYALPDEKTKSVIKTNSTKGGGGTNEIRFDDLKDKEQILLYAQKDLHVRTNNDRVASIGGDEHRTVAGNSFELIKKSRHSEITLDALNKIGGKRLTEVTGDVGDAYHANHTEMVDSAYYLNAGEKVVIEAGSEITLKVGGNFIKIDGQGITMLGTKIKINSGGSPGSATAVAFSRGPKKPLLADSAAPGRDTTYAGGEVEAPADRNTDAQGSHFTASWIEVELVDDEGQPVAGEPVDIIGPSGETLHGITGDDGVAHILVPKPGHCQISFTKLDGSAWEQKS